MAETYNASYMLLQVRESNKAAHKLYQGTMDFRIIKTEPAYYITEDAYTMRMDLDHLKLGPEPAPAANGVGHDEGEAVGSLGGAEEGEGAGEGGEKKKMHKVKVGRQLGVGALVERNESSATA